MKKKSFLLLIVLIFTFLLISGCKSNKANTDIEDNDIGTNGNESTGDENSTDDENKEDDPFTLDFDLTDVDGNIVNLSDYKGKTIFLNFFVTWCGPCMVEMPEFESFYSKHKDDVEIIIVNVNFDRDEKSVEEVAAWYEEANLSFPMLIDKDGSTTSNLYPYIQGYPTTFVFDKEGNNLGYLTGSLTEDAMEKIIDNYVN